MQGGARCEARGVLGCYAAAHPLPQGRQRRKMLGPFEQPGNSRERFVGEQFSDEGPRICSVGLDLVRRQARIYHLGVSLREVVARDPFAETPMGLQRRLEADSIVQQASSW